MAGLVFGAGRRLRTDALREALPLLEHHGSLRSEVLHTESSWGIGVAYRLGQPPDVAVDRDRRLAVVVQGKPVDRQRRSVTRATELLAGYVATGIDHLTSLDGGFVVVVVDGKAQQLTLVNDRTATLPMHVVLADGVCAVAPEGKAALRLAAATPTLDEIGALEFLAHGYAIGSRTLLQGVKLLEPATLLRADLVTGEARLERYWDLTFAPRRRVDERSAAIELDARLDDAVRSATEPRTAKTQLLLTGGYDARTLLAYLARADRLPDRTLTWGTREDLPRSDVALARRIAAAFGVPFEFVPYDHVTFEERARHWAVVSELASDNLGNFAAGPVLLLDGVDVPATNFIGDHMFGTGGIPLNAADAVEAGAGVPGDGSLPAGLAPLIAPSARRQVADATHAGLQAIVDRHDANTPKDLQDYLGLHLRVARWLNAPTYFREPMLAVCRPMLHAPIVELFSELPGELRVDRRLHVRMLRIRFPELFKIPIATTSSLIDWDVAFRGNGPAARLFHSLFDRERLSATPLASFLDVEEIVRRHTAFLDTSPRARTHAPHWLPRLRRAVSRSHMGSLAIRRLQRTTTRSMGREVGVTMNRALIRLGLLALFVDVLDSGDLLRAPFESQDVERAARLTASWWTDPETR